MRPHGTSTQRRARLAIAVLVLALAVLAAGRPERDATPTVQIAAAVQTHAATGSAASLTEPVRYADIDLELVASYLVDEGRLPGSVPAAHRRVWAVVERTLPASAVAHISQLNVVTDGVDGTLAMVHRSASEADRWILSLDLAEPADVLAPTVVHEYAHLLTLGRDDLDTSTATCAELALDIGCTRNGSLLGRWAQEFWTGVDEPAEPDLDVFVSAYAATSVHEDFAETFLAYVTEQPVRATPVIAAKLAFFDAHPELAEVAAVLRDNLARG